MGDQIYGLAAKNDGQTAGSKAEQPQCHVLKPSRSLGELVAPCTADAACSPMAEIQVPVKAQTERLISDNNCTAKSEEASKPPVLLRAQTVPAPATEDDEKCLSRSPLLALKGAVVKESAKQDRLASKWYGQAGASRKRKPSERF